MKLLIASTLAIAPFAPHLACSSPGLSANAGIEYEHETGFRGGIDIGFGTDSSGKTKNASSSMTPDVSMVGLCYQSNSVLSDGTIVEGEPVQIDGSTITNSHPDGTVSVHNSFFSWDDGQSPTTTSPTTTGKASAKRIPPRQWAANYLLTLDEFGGDNTQAAVMIQGLPITDPSTADPSTVQAALDSVLEASKLLLLDIEPVEIEGIEEAYFSSWKVNPAGDLIFTAAGLGSAMEEFQLVVNGVPELTHVRQWINGQWALGQATVPGDLFEVATSGGPTANNNVEFTYKVAGQGSVTDSLDLDLTID